MTESLIKFTIDPAFVLSRSSPTPCEIIYGYQNNWINDVGVVRILEQLLASGERLPKAMEEAALLLRAEYFRLPDLLRGEASPPGASGRTIGGGRSCWHLWLYLALYWVHDHPDLFADPSAIVECLYADFDYPPEMEALVPFMPARPDTVPGIDSINREWEKYLNLKYREFKVSRRTEGPVRGDATSETS